MDPVILPDGPWRVEVSSRAAKVLGFWFSIAFPADGESIAEGLGHLAIIPLGKAAQLSCRWSRLVGRAG
jgi:hypothetical protein